MLVELGIITKAHGFKGGFVVAGHGGSESALGYLKKLFIGRNPEEAVGFDVLEAAWMPKGWKLLVAGVTSDSHVKQLSGKIVFAPREALKPPTEGEFYTSDLVGLKVIDSESGQVVGILSGIEPGSAGSADRWWIEASPGSFSVPAIKKYIEKVDVEAKTVTLRHFAELNLDESEES